MGQGRVSVLGLLVLTALLQGQPATLDQRFAAVLNGTGVQDFSVGVALGGGAAKGLAHIGVLEALEEAGVRIDMVAGSSMGAVVGAGYASGLSVDSLENIALSSDMRQLVQLLDPAVFEVGILDGERIRLFLESHYGQRKIQDLPMPFAVTTVDLLTGRLYMIDSGDLSRAVRASMSIPLVFTAIKQDTMLLVDGAIVEPVPVSLLQEMGADYIIGVNVLVPPSGPPIPDELPRLNADQLLPGPPQSPRQRIDQLRRVKQPLNATEIVHRTFLLGEALVAEYSMQLTEPDLIIDVQTGLSAWNFLDAEVAISAGYETAQAALKNASR
jgi:NTE family protein